MDFYYDCILGLNYSSFFLNNNIFIVDIATLPKGFDIEEFMYRWKKHLTNGDVFLKSSEIDIKVLPLSPVITSNSLL